MTAVLTLQIPGEGRNGRRHGRYEKFLRIELEDARAATVRKAVTELLRKPSDYDLSGKTYRDHANSHRKKAPPVVRGDEDIMPGVEVVDRALPED